MLNKFVCAFIFLICSSVYAATLTIENRMVNNLVGEYSIIVGEEEIHRGQFNVNNNAEIDFIGSENAESVVILNIEGLNKRVAITLLGNNNNDRIIVNSLNEAVNPNGNNVVKSIAYV